MILNASTTVINFSASNLAPSLVKFFKESTTSRLQASLNHSLHLKGYNMLVPLTFVSYLIAGNWVNQDLEALDKISFFFLGINQKEKVYQL